MTADDELKCLVGPMLTEAVEDFVTELEAIIRPTPAKLVDEERVALEGALARVIHLTISATKGE